MTLPDVPPFPRAWWSHQTPSDSIPHCTTNCSVALPHTTTTVLSDALSMGRQCLGLLVFQGLSVMFRECVCAQLLHPRVLLLPTHQLNEFRDRIWGCHRTPRAQTDPTHHPHHYHMAQIRRFLSMMPTSLSPPQALLNDLTDTPIPLSATVLNAPFRVTPLSINACISSKQCLPPSLLARHQSSMRLLWVCANPMIPRFHSSESIHSWCMRGIADSSSRSVSAIRRTSRISVSKTLCLQRRGRKARRLLPGSYKGRVRRLSKDNARSSR